MFTQCPISWSSTERQSDIRYSAFERYAFSVHRISKSTSKSLVCIWFTNCLCKSLRLPTIFVVCKIVDQSNQIPVSVYGLTLK